MAGFLNLHKPIGWTSHDCVAKIRRLLTLKKVGHGGTLDPAACGVLPIALGRATRLLQFLPDDKAYRAVIRFGLTTATDDLEGEVLTSQPALDLAEARAIAALSTFIGTLEQIPPRYSAVQVKGKRLYDLARQGKDVEVPKRTVTIHHIAPVAWQPGEFPELTVDIACGAGTYIRSIARDLGAVLGVGATLSALTRTKSSGLTLDSSLSLEQLESQVEAGTYIPIAPEILLQHLPRIILSEDPAKRWQQGQKIPFRFRDADLNCPHYQVFDATYRFLGITAWAFIPDTDETRLLPKVVFTPP
ncbi:tRNA pseudouridine(55) synthase TruB [Oscillatoria sp. CS-180]|uniref:tRNA pseudouridine(55) synthase TruB n=1 Tax=Oscillatoria sp. CS-180 TaxID=3021720 RepID=UPI0023308C8E|nr:tRNA pseudouridine(55) synthase TruB [Oscillatoria sp. CS-180]MDB9525933.1 tRNA pseudouridine(55) synthase TruB [Oscillatoria sp. CS-180]